jgi:hypothetical protein
MVFILGAIGGISFATLGQRPAGHSRPDTDARDLADGR